MAKNRIIVFGNQKGGVGKSTLCVIMAHWLASQHKKVIVYDGDTYQKSIYLYRQDELKAHPDDKTSWDVKLINSNDIVKTKKTLDEAAQFDGYVLIDCPGSLTSPGVAPILQTADAIIVPFSYDTNTIHSTTTFIQVLFSPEIKQEKERVFFVPNQINDRIGTKQEKEQWDKIKQQLSNFGKVTERVKYTVDVKRYSTLYYTKAQIDNTKAAWTTVINKLKRLD